jgi:hypothetical protein
MAMSDDDERNLFNSAVFKRGIHEFLAPTNASDTDGSSAADDDQAPADDADSSDREIKLREVYGESVVDLYKKAQQQKLVVSLDLLSQAVLGPEDITTIESLLGNTKAISSFAAKNRKIITRDAGLMLASLPKRPLQNAEQIDGLLAAHLADPTPKINRNGKRDQWDYRQPVDSLTLPTQARRFSAQRLSAANSLATTSIS